MINKRAMLAGVLMVCSLAAAGCTSDNGITYDGIRRTALGAGASPATCPIPFDVAAALPDGRAAQPGEVAVQTSKTTTPAADPLVAQRDQGMSALDAAAGVSIDCEYDVDGKTVDVWLIVTPGPSAILLMAPRLTRAAHLTVVQVQDFVDHAPGPGDVALAPGDDIAVGRVPVQGDGYASLLVDPDGVVTGDALSKTTATLLGQIHN